MQLTNEQMNRALGVLSATAAGDALGAGYEFGPALPESTKVFMKGGGPFKFEPNEWTDDTAMSLIIAKALAGSKARGLELDGDESLSRIVRGWMNWSKVSKDVGAQTRTILRNSENALQNNVYRVSPATAVLQASKSYHELYGRSAGNGSLMRTSVLTLAYLDENSEDDLWTLTGKISQLTHYEIDATEACQIWTAAIRKAILTGELDVRAGFDKLDEERRKRWGNRIEMAEKLKPSAYRQNGWVVEAFQASWSSITKALNETNSDSDFLRASLENAVRGGGDTDTVAAITGGLIGAYCGRSSIPNEWLQDLHGYGAKDDAEIQSIAISLFQ